MAASNVAINVSAVINKWRLIVNCNVVRGGVIISQKVMAAYGMVMAVSYQPSKYARNLKSLAAAMAAKWLAAYLNGGGSAASIAKR